MLVPYSEQRSGCSNDGAVPGWDPGTALNSALSAKESELSVRSDDSHGEVFPHGSDAKQRYERRHVVIAGYITAVATLVAAVAALLEVFLR